MYSTQIILVSYIKHLLVYLCNHRRTSYNFLRDTVRLCLKIYLHNIRAVFRIRFEQTLNTEPDPG